MRIGVIIPALNEADSIKTVILACLNAKSPDDEMRMIVCDNGSTDDTPRIAQQAGAEVVYEPQRGYGAACLRAIDHLAHWPEAVVFMEGDGSSDPNEIESVLKPIRRNQADLSLGWRQVIEPQSMSLPQRFGNALSCALIRLRWGHAYRDCGPLRAITLPVLEQLQMRDRTWGWNIEMQIMAILQGLRVTEVPVRWLRRQAGHSKISGTISGVIRAGGKILWTFGQYALRSKQRRRPPRDIVLAFMKYPHPGQVKTRLASSVGPARAAKIYKRLAQDTHRQLMKLQSSGLADVAICYTNHDAKAFQKWLPGARYYWPQPDGDLGTRLQKGLARAFAKGAARVAAVGTDCPSMNMEVIVQSLSELENTDLAGIPATDGGYALIAMKKNQPQLFEDICWSSSVVMEQTRQRAAELGLEMRLGSELSDVDTKEDLITLPPYLSIVIPVLNEEQLLKHNLPSLLRQIRKQQEEIELIVVEGGSQDTSVQVAQDFGATVLSASKGRAMQMNVGSRHARGDWLWFLHVDCELPEEALRQLIDQLQDAVSQNWGYFRARIALKGLTLRAIEWGMNLRCRWLNLPYGDQGIFVRRDVFNQIGGYVESPTLEVVMLVQMLSSFGEPIRIHTPLLINARRWQKFGAWPTTKTNWKIMFDYFVCRKDNKEIVRQYRQDQALTGPTTLMHQKGAFS